MNFIINSAICEKDFKYGYFIPCSLAQGFQSLSDFMEHLAASVDIVFPVIHGRFGEDGGIQVNTLKHYAFFKNNLSMKVIIVCMMYLHLTGATGKIKGSVCWHTIE